MASTAPRIATLIAGFAVALVLAFVVSTTTAQPAQADHCGLHRFTQNYQNCAGYPSKVTISYFAGRFGNGGYLTWCMPRGWASASSSLGIPIAATNHRIKCKLGPGGSRRVVAPPA